MCCCEWALVMAAENAKSAQTDCGNGQPGLQLTTLPVPVPVPVPVPLGMRGHGRLQPAMTVTWPLFQRLLNLCRWWRVSNNGTLKAAVLWSHSA